jgi:alpha-tubulin suppressor-like RCC1 family protein
MRKLKVIFSAMLLLVFVISFQNCSSDFRPNQNIPTQSASEATTPGLVVGPDGQPLVINATPTPSPASILGSARLISRSNTSNATGYTCAVLDGAVKCAGTNYFGLLGASVGANRPTMQVVAGLSTGVESIAGSGNHVCALSAGAVKCWGLNTYGQLGTGDLISKNIPTDVVGLSTGVKMISSGDSHNCALMTTGGVKCWGRNDFGAIGDGTAVARPTAVDVPGLSSGVASIATGGNHSCAVMVAGGIKCWGRNDTGQLGDGTLVLKRIPTDVLNISSGVNMISAGYSFTCAIISGGVNCWGNNYMGQLGNGTLTQSSVPVATSGLASGVTEITTSDQNSCAVIGSGATATSKCWGNNNYGAVGDGSTTIRSTPVNISLLNGIQASALSSSAFHSCALTATSIKCWGLNTVGQLGDGTYNSPFNPDPLIIPGGVGPTP